jgi:hypothetical protein
MCILRALEHKQICNGHGEEIITINTCKLLLDAFQFVALVETSECQTEAYSSLDLTGVEWHIRTLRYEGQKVTLWAEHRNVIHGENTQLI